MRKNLQNKNGSAVTKAVPGGATYQPAEIRQIALDCSDGILASSTPSQAVTSVGHEKGIEVDLTAISPEQEWLDNN